MSSLRNLTEVLLGQTWVESHPDTRPLKQPVDHSLFTPAKNQGLLEVPQSTLVAPKLWNSFPDLWSL